MTAKLKDRLTTLSKNPKLLITAGLIGILLIAASSFIPSSKKESVTVNKDTADTYLENLESDIKSLVLGLTGDKDATVVITLESGTSYTYADSTQSDSTTSNGEKSSEEKQSKSTSYVTVKSSDGGETPLILYENMPQIRGVAIICNGGDDADTADKITSAVTAALNITSKRVFVSGGKYYEKG